MEWSPLFTFRVKVNQVFSNGNGKSYPNKMGAA